MYTIYRAGHAVYVMCKPDGLAFCLVTDMEYPQRVAFTILKQARLCLHRRAAARVCELR
jgi:hypothetical protein